MNQDDNLYMKRAIDLSRRGSPIHSPYVGCVIVKDNQILSEGWYKGEWEQHAEVMAFNALERDKIKGSTLYVTVEPCSVYARTPPCARSIIENDIKRVVIGMFDPNPLTERRCIKRFEDAGIEVRAGVLQKEITEVNRHYVEDISKLISEQPERFRYTAVLALSGLPGSGKSKLTSIISEIIDAEVVSVSSFLTQRAKLEGLGSTREAILNIRQKLQEEYGKTGLLDLALQYYSAQGQKSQILVIDAIRQINKIDFLKNRYGSYVKVIGVTAPQAMRFHRIKVRDNVSLEDFLEREKWEIEIGTASCFGLSDYVVNNCTNKEADIREKALELLDTFYLL